MVYFVVYSRFVRILYKKVIQYKLLSWLHNGKMKEYEEIKRNNPEFVEYVEKKHKKDLTIIFSFWVLSLIIIRLIYILYKPALQNLLYIYALLGSFSWAVGAIKTPKSIVPLSMARVGYSKPLADEFLKTSKEVSIGIWLILLSIIIQIWLYYK